MAAGSDYFNGITCLFASATIGKLAGIKFSSKGKVIPLTSNDDAAGINTVGKPEHEVTLTLVGAPGTYGIGSVGALTITWPDATTHGTLTKAVISSIEKNAQLDGAVGSDVSLVPSI